MAFYAGQLREHCTLQSRAGGKTGNGFVVDTYTTVGTVACAVNSVSGKDFYQALAAGAADVVTFTMRWADGITNAHRVVWDGITYEILEINYLGARRDYMQLKCRAVRGSAEH